MMEIKKEGHPRKIFQREQWTSLNGVWDFVFDDSCEFQFPEEIKLWNLQINVPFAPESTASGLGNTDFHPRVWYRKRFAIQPADPQKLYFLHFGAVDYLTHVWLNGHYLGKHEGGFTPFHFNFTHLLLADQDQTIILRVDDDPHDLTKPRGKQDWQKLPHSIWYPRTTGIWQSVWIEEVSNVFIEKIRCIPHLERWELGIEAFIQGTSLRPLELKVLLSCHGQKLAQDSYTVIQNEVHRRISLSDPGIDDFRNELLWSPERPTLIQMELELWSEGVKLDHIHSYTALRSVSYNKDRFLLNGRPYYLRLVLDQGLWPETLMTPPSEVAIEKEIQLIKAAGFNGVRKHQKIEDPNFLYWADVMGLVVWGEMPSAYRFTHKSVNRLVAEWTEVLDRDMNHPCLITWVPFNESWGVPDLAEKAAHQHCVQALYHLTKTYDPSRPCIGNDGWESTATDIVGIHDYDDNPERLLKKYAQTRQLGEIVERYRPAGRVIMVDGHTYENRPVMLTEFGGISFVAPENRVENAWGYSVAQTTHEFQTQYQELMNAIHRIELFAGFCYTQLTDTFQETNGLLRMDRTPKFPLNIMARATRGIGLERGEKSSVPQPPPIPHDNAPIDMKLIS